MIFKIELVNIMLYNYKVYIFFAHYNYIPFNEFTGVKKNF